MILWVVRWVKRQKMAQYDKNNVCLTLFLRSCTSLCDFNRDTLSNFSIFIVINISFLLRKSWIIFLTSGTLYSILMMSSLFLHSIFTHREFLYKTRSTVLGNQSVSAGEQNFANNFLKSKFWKLLWIFFDKMVSVCISII